MKPNWDALFELASPQAGFFRPAQAQAAGFSKQLIHKHVLSGRIRHPSRGVYRLAHFPSGEQDELIELWLWSGELGVFSHETALALHQLSDALPSRVHLTVPRNWVHRTAIPEVVVLHRADVPESDRTWIDRIPVTTVGRTLRDAFDAGVDPVLIAQAISEGTARKLLRRADVRGIVAPTRAGKRARRESAGA